MKKGFCLVAMMVLGVVVFGEWSMSESSIVTRWAKDVTPERVWQEYPRPQLVRPEWKSLNGLWDYAIVSRSAAAPSEPQGQILVPFCVESALSGVKKEVTPEDRIWYRRSFEMPAGWAGKRVILHFEAVDWEAAVWVNDVPVGSHKGAYDRFSFDITDCLKKQGRQEVRVAVWDPTNFGTQARGKQQMPQQGIWYTPVSGIWQTVWLEATPREAAIKEVRIVPDVDASSVTVTPMLFEPKREKYEVKITVLDGEKAVAQATGPADRTTVIKLNDPKLWSPDTPFLYDLKLELVKDGDAVDAVTSYFGMRKISLGEGPFGKVLHLNNEPLFHYGTLDQGWWPDGLHTPPSDEAMKYDIEITKEMGFNMIRKHIKVEPDRWYYWCDRLGMLVWQDMPSGMVVLPGEGNRRPVHLQHVPRDGEDLQRRGEDAAQYEWELRRMIDLHGNAPSIVMWVPFNEGWGQYDTCRVAAWVKEYDPSRLVNAVSGWALRPCGDVYDIHTYQETVQVPTMQADRATVIGEYGGIGYPIEEHLWNPKMRNWGYQTYQSAEELYEKYVHKFRQIAAMKEKGLSAAVYTQTTDVEGEVNGLLTYDREVIKIAPEKLKRLHSVLYGAGEAKAAANASAEGLKRHDRALYVKEGWIRDPYIVMGPDGFYYLTGTTPLPDDPREAADPYNTGLGPKSIVGYKMALWRSQDLIEWESLGTPYSLEDGIWYEERPRRFQNVDRAEWRLWAPELHFIDGKWVIVHTSPSPVNGANLSVTKGDAIAGPYANPMGTGIQKRHDPSLYVEDGKVWMLWGATQIAQLKEDLSGLATEPVAIGPSDHRIGHEGSLIRKIGGKYVLFGTGWSTDQMRKGTYNLYYCVSDKITGPYGPRQFAGRFLGHGTPFQDKEGRWWCTAFYNANVPPLSRGEIKDRPMGDDAYTINEQGVTIVPLEVKVEEDGGIFIRAKDPDYARPGAEEAQEF